MKLYFSATSPYVRKVTVLAAETGLAGRIERLPTATTPIANHAELGTRNPLVKVPCLITDDGMALYDSRVICEYLDGLHGGAKLFPAEGKARFVALTNQALGDGLLDAALLLRYEGFLRPEALRWAEWTKGQQTKLDKALAEIERQAAGFGALDIGQIAIGCALGYLDFRFGALNWKARHPAAAAWYAKLMTRPSFQQTIPADPPPA